MRASKNVVAHDVVVVIVVVVGGNDGGGVSFGR